MPKRAVVVEVGAGEECCPSVLAAPLDEVRAVELARGFAALADPARLRVISMLAAAAGGEVCVCEFVEPLGKSQPTVSHHLKVLGDAGLVVGHRRGKWVCGTRSSASDSPLSAPPSPLRGDSTITTDF